MYCNAHWNACWRIAIDQNAAIAACCSRICELSNQKRKVQRKQHLLAFGIRGTRPAYFSHIGDAQLQCFFADERRASNNIVCFRKQSLEKHRAKGEALLMILLLLFVCPTHHPPFGWFAQADKYKQFLPHVHFYIYIHMLLFRHCCIYTCMEHMHNQI